MEPVSVGLSPDGLRVFVASQRESQLEHFICAFFIFSSSRMFPKPYSEGVFRVCGLGGGAADRPAAVRVGGDELHLQPPAVIHLRRQVFCGPGQQKTTRSVCDIKLFTLTGFGFKSESFISSSKSCVDCWFVFFFR